MVTPGQRSDNQLVSEAIKASRLSARDFARCIAKAPLRRVNGWLNGANVVSDDVRRRLEWFLSLSPSEQLIYVNGALSADANASVRADSTL